MFYCKKCKILTTCDRCHRCGTRKTRHPLPNDEVHLTTVNSEFLIEGILNENKIPFYKRIHGLPSFYGGGLRSHAYYVPYGAYQRATELIKTLAPSD